MLLEGVYILRVSKEDDVDDGKKSYFVLVIYFTDTRFVLVIYHAAASFAT